MCHICTFPEIVSLHMLCLIESSVYGVGGKNTRDLTNITFANSVSPVHGICVVYILMKGPATHSR